MSKTPERKNHNVTIKIANILNEIKDFDAAYSADPKLGRILIKYKDAAFFLDISPVYLNDELDKQDFNEIWKDNKHWLTR